MKGYFLSILFCYFAFTQDEYLVTIDASSYSNWVYFSVEQNSVISIDDPENSLEWDFAFQRKHIKTNGGLSGIGNGGAFVDSSIDRARTGRVLGVRCSQSTRGR